MILFKAEALIKTALTIQPSYLPSSKKETLLSVDPNTENKVS
jgi:hypothetical protein